MTLLKIWGIIGIDSQMPDFRNLKTKKATLGGVASSGRREVLPLFLKSRCAGSKTGGMLASGVE